MYLNQYNPESGKYPYSLNSIYSKTSTDTLIISIHQLQEFYLNSAIAEYSHNFNFAQPNTILWRFYMCKIRILYLLLFIFQRTPKMPEKLQTGEFRIHLLALKWQDKRQVCMSFTSHSVDSIQIVKRKITKRVNRFKSLHVL